MTNISLRRMAPCACLLLASVSSPVWAAQADPFEHYQSWRDEPVQDWRASNDRVGEVGGWRTYLRESQAAGGGHDHGAPPSQPAADPHGHHGHHHHGH